MKFGKVRMNGCSKGSSHPLEWFLRRTHNFEQNCMKVGKKASVGMDSV